MQDFDQAVFEVIFGWSRNNVLLDNLGVFVSEYLAWALVLVFLILLLGEKDRRRRVFLFAEAAMSVIVSRGLTTEVIRFFYDRPRPFEVFGFTPLISETTGSFPSGHAAFFFALAIVVYFWNRRWGWWYFAAAFLIGLARIFAGVHWPLDVLGGALLGVASALVVHALLRPYAQKLIGSIPTI